MAGRILAGRYELIEKIGEGGMAVVFKARDRLLNRLVAIKILRPEYTKDAVFVESFRRESQVAAGLVHPNIVNVYDVGREGNIYYIVMELIEGEPLSAIIREEGRIDPYRATAIAKQIASGLATAHRNQLIHRDVKPHNIMITKDGVAKITDFGIAKAVSKDTLVGGKKEDVMGSVHYFSPEQARGAYIDERSDIYSLGIVLFEMLTGRVPFDGETAIEVAVKQINEEMPNPTDIEPSIPKDLEDIILKATSKLQTDRYKTADDMITALNFVRFTSRHPMVDSANAEAAAGHRRGEVPAAPPAGNAVSVSEESAVSEGRKKKKGKGKPGLSPALQRLIALAAAILLALPASNFAYKLIYGPGEQGENPNPPVVSTGKPVIVPDLAGMTVSDAENELKKLGLVLDVDLELPSDTVPKGNIMSQKPAKDTEVKSGYAVRVNVSKGVVDGTVPGLVGKTKKGAKSLIEGYGYALGTESSEHSDEIPNGCIIRQSPKEGSKLAAGGKINIVVSMGSAAPSAGSVDVVGMTLEEATELIASKGFTASVQYTEHVSVPKDRVISQYPDENQILEPGSEICLVISLGNGQPGEGEGQGSEGEGDTPPGEKKAVAILVDYSLAQTDDFTLTVHVYDKVNGTSVQYRQVPKNRAMVEEYITVYGNGELGRAVIMFDNQTICQYTVDFENGQYY